MNWMPDVNKTNLRYMVAWWIFFCLVLIYTQWRSKRCVGLPVAYALNLSLIHLFGAFSYCFDYYVPRSPTLIQSGLSLESTFRGFWIAVVGMGAFTLGTLISLATFKGQGKIRLTRPWPAVTSKLPATLLTIAFCFFFLNRVLSRIPSMASLSSAGSNISVLAVTLFCFEAVRRGEHRKLIQWLAATAGFPMMTVIFLGFAGYGMTAAATAWVFILKFIKPKWIATFMFLAMCYGGVSLYVNYMRERDSIRDAVWGERTLSSRFDRVVRVFTYFEFFDPNKQRHLETVDLRMNQNDLAGKAVEYIQSNRVNYAEGGTLMAAAVSWVPRILWPNKPKTGGSGSLVSRFTGMKFGDSTSVGVGQVMEFYINWGIPSLIICFFLYGVVMQFFDMMGAYYLNRGDYWTFARWMLPALPMLLAGGVMTEVVGSMAAAWVLLTIFHWSAFSGYYQRLNQQPGSGRGSKQVGLPTSH